MTLAAVVPTRNEGATIGMLVRHLFGIADAVYVADDSDDQTALLALSEGAQIVDPPPGLGPAYLDAWKKIPPDMYVVHVDAGGSHPIDSIRRVSRSARSADIVIGSRFMRGGHHEGPRWRSLASRVMSAAMNVATWYDITDWTSGLRTYSPGARAYLSTLEYSCEGHAFQIEVLHAARMKGLTIREVPIDYLPSGSSLNWARAKEALGLWWDILRA